MAWLLRRFIELLEEAVQQLTQLNQTGEKILAKIDDLLKAVDGVGTAAAAVATAIQDENSELQLVVTELKAGGTDTTQLDAAIANLSGIATGLTTAAQAAKDAGAAAKAADPNTPAQL
jgi:septal ring factor EnvC (AmiA/AmiB activator)